MRAIMKRDGHDMWRPFDLLEDWQHEMNRLFNRSLLKNKLDAFEPEVDVMDEKDHYLVKVDLPGIKKEEMNIKIEGRMLTLKGERKEEKETKEKNYYASERFYGAFTRMIAMPTDVRADQVKATYKDGVLEISLPKAEGAKAKEVTVEVK
jgi:HSP20 family protein